MLQPRDWPFGVTTDILRALNSLQNQIRRKIVINSSYYQLVYSVFIIRSKAN